MRMWLPEIVDFRRVIWDRLRNGATVEELSFVPEIGENPQSHVFIDIPFEPFRIFGFLYDTSFKTNAPGTSVNRNIGLYDNI